MTPEKRDPVSERYTSARTRADDFLRNPSRSSHCLHRSFLKPGSTFRRPALAAHPQGPRPVAPPAVIVIAVLLPVPRQHSGGTGRVGAPNKSYDKGGGGSPMITRVCAEAEQMLASIPDTTSTPTKAFMRPTSIIQSKTRCLQSARFGRDPQRADLWSAQSPAAQNCTEREPLTFIANCLTPRRDGACPALCKHVNELRAVDIADVNKRSIPC